MSPDRPMMSAFSRLAVSRIFCAGTMTPRSITSIVVALEHDADDVLADVVHVALDGGHHDLAGRGPQIEAGGLLLGLQERLQISHRLLHDARRLHHLRQEHLARAEQVAHHVHAGHQRALDHLDRFGKRLRAASVSASM